MVQCLKQQLCALFIQITIPTNLWLLILRFELSLSMVELIIRIKHMNDANIIIHWQTDLWSSAFSSWRIRWNVFLLLLVVAWNPAVYITSKLFSAKYIIQLLFLSVSLLLFLYNSNGKVNPKYKQRLGL